MQHTNLNYTIWQPLSPLHPGCFQFEPTLTRSIDPLGSLPMCPSPCGSLGFLSFQNGMPAETSGPLACRTAAQWMLPILRYPIKL